jgi:hypothetical protein
MPGSALLRRALVRAGISDVSPWDGAAPPGAGALLLLRADHVFDAALVAGLARAPGVLLCRPDERRPVAAHLPDRASAAAVAAALESGRGAGDPAFAGLRPLGPSGLADAYNRALRKRGTPYLLRLAPETRAAVEWEMLGGSYKGVTDAVTKHVWPRPAFQVVRICAALGITPNQVTLASLVLVFLALCEIGHVRHVAHHEIVILALADAVPVAQQCFDLLLRRVAGLFGNRRDHDETQPGLSRHLLLQGRQWDDNSVVVVAAKSPRRLALRLQYPHDPEGQVGDPYGLTDGIDPRKKILSNGFADHGHIGCRFDILLSERSSHLKAPVADLKKLRLCTSDAGAPVLVPIHHVPVGVRSRRGDGHGRDLAQYRLHVFIDEGFRLAPAHTHAAARDRPAAHPEQIRPAGGDLLLHLGARSLADADHCDHCAHADNDAQHGKGRAHLVTRQRPHCDL